MKNTKKEMTYLASVHRDGFVWGIILSIAILAFPLVLFLLFGAEPQWKPMIKGMLSIVPMYWAVGIVEIFTYIPMLGAGGSYLSFVTGNISNLKLPCAINALENAQLDPKSEEGEIVSTIVRSTISTPGINSLSNTGMVTNSPTSPVARKCRSV